MNIVNMLVRLFECQCDVVGLKIMMRVPLAIRLTYFAGTSRVLCDWTEFVVRPLLLVGYLRVLPSSSRRVYALA